MQDLDGERRKEAEVALHAGTLLALGLPRPSVWLGVATIPAALAGALLEGPIERRLGTPRSLAAGLALGGVAMAAADAAGSRARSGPPPVRDALVLGLAQATALVPGVSRHGAALTALRLRGFRREAAHAISREASRPILAGATALKGARLAHRLARGAGGPSDGSASPVAEALPLALAAGASAVSTRLALRALRGRGASAPLWPYAAYRAVLAAVALGTVRPVTSAGASLQGRVVAITGGARGIGRALAVECLRRGATVAIGDVDEAAVLATGEALGVTAQRLDVTDRPSFEAFLDAVESGCGPLDVLVNNAGIAPIGTFAEEDDAVTRRILDVDLFGVALGSKLAIARMRPRGRGHVVNVASGAGRFAVPALASYSAAKAGVIGLTETLRMELRTTGIDVSVVMPGPVETDMIAHTRRTRKLQTVTAEEAARLIADGIEARRFEIWIPRQNAALHRLTAPLGTPFRQWVTRKLELDRMYAEADAEQRRGIEERMRA